MGVDIKDYRKLPQAERRAYDKILSFLIFLDSIQKARKNPDCMHELPLHTPVRRLDEVGAARNPRLRYRFGENDG